MVAVIMCPPPIRGQSLGARLNNYAGNSAFRSFNTAGEFRNGIKVNKSMRTRKVGANRDKTKNIPPIIPK